MSPRIGRPKLKRSCGTKDTIRAGTVGVRPENIFVFEWLRVPFGDLETLFPAIRPDKHEWDRNQ
jgi:hypothetical protein